MNQPTPYSNIEILIDTTVFVVNSGKLSSNVGKSTFYPNGTATVDTAGTTFTGIWKQKPDGFLVVAQGKDKFGSHYILNSNLGAFEVNEIFSATSSRGVVLTGNVNMKFVSEDVFNAFTSSSSAHRRKHIDSSSPAGLFSGLPKSISTKLNN